MQHKLLNEAKKLNVLQHVKASWLIPLRYRASEGYL